MSKREKHKADTDAWADQIRLKADELKTCIGSAAINPKWVDDVCMEIDTLTSDTIRLGYVTAEDGLGK